MNSSRLAWILVVPALAFGVWQCIDLMWACDDAYISMRYARNLVEGHGLIFNPGAPDEVVEGYSNFSWTMLLALGYGLGASDQGIVPWAGWLSLLFHLGTALLLVNAALRLARADERGGWVAVPVGAIALSCHHYWASLAVCGLETALFTFLVTAMVVLGVGARTFRALALLGVLAAMACLTRPDGAIPATVLGMALILRSIRQRRLSVVLTYGISAASLLVPHMIWRLSYYGEFVPNTAFAKSASDPYLGQGLFYVGTYFQVYWVVGVGFLAVLWVAVRSGTGSADASGSDPWSQRGAIARLCVAVILLYVGFAVWVGGDFMFSRFLLPVTPLLYFGFDLLRPWIRSIQGGVVLTAVVVVGTLVVFPQAWLEDFKNPHGISDNRAISYVPMDDGTPRVEAFRTAGEMARTITEGLDCRVALHGSHANLAYYGRFPIAVETAAGLTDARIARIRPEKRGMVGHDKLPRDFAGYLEERGVAINFNLGWRAGNPVDKYVGEVFGAGTQPLRAFLLRDERFPGVQLPGTLVTYQRELMEEIRRRAPYTIFVDFPKWLDEVYLPRLAGAKPKRVAKDLAAFDLFYFDHNDDPGRREPIAAQAEKGGG